MFSYANGKYVQTEELSLPVALDPIGTFRGFRIFTACRTVGGKIFHLEDHIDRLFNSAKVLYMELPHAKERLKEIIQEITAKNRENDKQDLLLEIIYSGGAPAGNGVAPAGSAFLYVLVLPLKRPPLSWYEQGIRLAVYPYQRQWPEVKLLNYVGAVIAHQTVVKKYGADEALFVSPDNQRIILEGTTFNFFIVQDNTILTRPLDGKILPGITRKIALGLAKSEGLRVKEDYFSYDDLSQTDEAFITSSTRNIVPVVKIDDILIGKALPGEITQKLERSFLEYQRNY